MEETNLDGQFLNFEEIEYLSLLDMIIKTGHQSDDRTGVGTKSLFAPTTLHFSQEGDSFPVITSRKIFYRGAIEEFLWMIKGEYDANLLKEKGVHFWDGNTTKEFIEKRGLSGFLEEGHIGPLYGFQLRNWGGSYTQYVMSNKQAKGGVDQLKKVVDILKKDPTSRRAVISMYNVSQLDFGVLEPCHAFYVFYVNQETNGLSCHLTLRSADSVLGTPMNILFTALLNMVVAKLVGLNPEGIALTGVNWHVYNNQFDGAKKMMEYPKAGQHKFPTIKLNKELKSLEDVENLEYSDFLIENYVHGPSIKFDMAI